MGNIYAPGKRAKHGENLVQRIRAGILGAFDVSEKKGMLISEMLSVEWEKNPLKFLEVAAKHLPKEITAEITRTYEANKLTDDELADVIAKRARKRHDDALQADQDKVAAAG